MDKERDLNDMAKVKRASSVQGTRKSKQARKRRSLNDSVAVRMKRQILRRAVIKGLVPTGGSRLALFGHHIIVAFAQRSAAANS